MSEGVEAVKNRVAGPGMPGRGRDSDPLGVTFDLLVTRMCREVPGVRRIDFRREGMDGRPSQRGEVLVFRKGIRQ
jgi:hypothetical protein